MYCCCCYYHLFYYCICFKKIPLDLSTFTEDVDSITNLVFTIIHLQVISLIVENHMSVEWTAKIDGSKV